MENRVQNYNFFLILMYTHRDWMGYLCFINKLIVNYMKFRMRLRYCCYLCRKLRRITLKQHRIRICSQRKGFHGYCPLLWLCC